ncbi:MAG: WhiB family transcriptional regulator [Acidimicrobiales bacterium]
MADPKGVSVDIQALINQGPRAWQARANCMGVDPELFFPERGSSTVRVECLEFAIANSEKFGIWGGMSERERRRVRRARLLQQREVAAS